MKYQFEINQKNYDVTIGSVSGEMARVTVNGETYDVRIKKTPAQPMAVVQPAVQATSPVPQPRAAEAAPVIIPATSSGPVEGEPILAPIPGLILDVKVAVGETISAGQTVAIIEAMKMENSIASHVSGQVRDIRIQKGSQVSTRDVIMIIG
ncbi:MAG: acetyl-CoA carboxylase biotin carboxyl carrier protein subunit [Desulfobacteraceae bacterium]|nr:MAG: acetyl-CoA carboxylase biotin carboxyl carrier protein subunit [Desulfobacteraceae bacterium]